jgi:hypothetical protein
MVEFTGKIDDTWQKKLEEERAKCETEFGAFKQELRSTQVQSVHCKPVLLSVECSTRLITYKKMKCSHCAASCTVYGYNHPFRLWFRVLTICLKGKA